MSLMAATTCEGAIFDYCNYGYDKNLYSSYNDCMNKRTKQCKKSSNNNDNQNKKNNLIVFGTIVSVILVSCIVAFYIGKNNVEK